MKTETSQKPLPMVGALAETLQDWKTHSIYTNPEDWVFASPVMRGTQPYWPGSLLVKRIRPAALRVGITYRLAYIPQDVCNVAAWQHPLRTENIRGEWVVGIDEGVVVALRDEAVAVATGLPEWYLLPVYRNLPGRAL